MAADLICGRCGFPIRQYAQEGRSGETSLVYLHPDGSGEHEPHLAILGVEAVGVRYRVDLEVEEDDEDVELEPHPDPLVRAREPEPDEIPGGARSLLKVAERAGVPTRVRYARGVPSRNGQPVHAVRVELRWNESGDPVLTDNGKQATRRIRLPEHKVVESVVVWFGDLAVALWEDGKMAGCWVKHPWLQPVSSTVVRAGMTWSGVVGARKEKKEAVPDGSEVG